MQIILYKSADNPLKAVKQFTQVSETLNCDIYDITSLIKPVFTVDFNINYRDATHVFIPELGESGWYFYITRIEEKSATTQILWLELDVRCSLYSEYKECVGNIIRSDLGHPTDVVDEKLPLKINNNVQHVIHFDEYQNSYFENDTEPNVLLMTL